MVLADVHVLYGQWEESEQMLSGLLKTSNLRASYSQSSPGNEALGQGEEEAGGAGAGGLREAGTAQSHGGLD